MQRIARARGSLVGIIVLAAWGGGLMSCTGGDVHEQPRSTGRSTAPSGNVATMDDCGSFLILRASFKIAKVRCDQDVITAMVTYTGSCERATGRITFTAEHGEAAGSVDIGPFVPDTPRPVSVPLPGPGAMTLTFAKTGCE